MATKTSSRVPVRKITMTAVMAAVASVLMFFPTFKLPFMPSFISLDFSELPALLASFTLGPVSGVCVCFVKNMVNLMSSNTGGVGELSNFILGAAFVLPAGLLYKHRRSFSGAAIGSVLGAVLMATLGFFSNLYVVYPIYTNLMPMEAIMGMYQAINPSVQELWEALLVFNVPFTFCKGMISVIVTLAAYRKLEPIINGKFTA